MAISFVLEGGIAMLYACDECLFLFEAKDKPIQCPDCGKFAVREATLEEIEEYRKRSAVEDNWK